MTATAAPRAAAVVDDTAKLGSVPILLASEIALAALSVATIVGLRRLFVGGEWFAPLAIQAVLAHATAAVLRRRGVPLLPAVLATLLLGLFAISWFHVGESTTFGIPTGTTLDAIGSAIGDASDLFSEIKAPTTALPGFVIACAGSIWIGAVLADWAGFRVDAPLEATLPMATLFVLAAVLGADVDRVLASGLFVAAGLGFVLLRRADRLGRTATWVGDHRSTGPRALVLLGATLALAAVVVAAVVGPRLPGARSDAIVNLTDLGDDGPGTRVTISPLVDIRSRLVDQAAVEVFTVRSPVRSYWRLTSLDRFDGRIWSSNGSYGKASGRLDDGVPSASQRIDFEQSFSISALAQIWLPAAYEPQAIRVATPVRYDEVSGTIIVDTEIPTSDNVDYVVASSLPQHDPAALGQATRSMPSDVADQYLDLPGDFPDSVRQLAQEITAGSGSAYEASLRLQNFFRDNFTYDLDVGSGHSEQAIEQFVLDLRRGYCEQFAGSFAAMARAVGIPARVAVGFTPGNSTPADPTLYRVRGEHAHAWPEVFLGEYGWVAFEPTPGRGAPLAEQYTGVAEQQVVSGGDPTTATTTVSPPSTDASAVPSTTAPLPPEFPQGDQGFETGDEPEPAASPWFGRIALTAGLLLCAVALYLLTVLTLTTLRRHRRRRDASGVESKVALAWEESLAAIRRAGVPVRAAETQREVAMRVSHRLPTVEAPLRQLAGTVQTVTYAPSPPEGDVGDRALALADDIGLRATATLSTGERFVAQFHPRRLRDD